MYHDQALIPLKTLHFDEGINVTLGLPIVRTSPDHGTAFDIAGKDMADPERDDRRDPHRGRMRAPARRGVTPPSLPPLREVIARHGLSASKALGQNFLLDEQLLDRIARIPGPLAGERVYEVGPGPGGLTRALLRAGAEVVAVERDRRCLAPLAELAEAFPGRLTDPRGRRAGDRRGGVRSGRRMSSPTCPTMSAPPCWCAGSAARRGRPGGHR